MKRFLISFVLLFFANTLFALEPIVDPDFGKPTGVAPYYFGPNAFPVPEMMDGYTFSDLHVELAVDGYFGYKGDKTEDIFARINIPLFTRWVNLSVWIPAIEWFQMTTERQAECRLQDSIAISGYSGGDAYVSTDIQVLSKDFKRLKDKPYAHYIPDITVRAVLKSASGGNYGKARYYDAPGYWFDATFGGEILKKESPISLRWGFTGGFSCWQTSNGRQNDGIMYGLKLNMGHQYVNAQIDWRGYIGWENYGDRPMVTSAKVTGHIKGFHPYILYQYGIKDYPFHQLRVGLVYTVSILKNK